VLGILAGCQRDAFPPALSLYDPGTGQYRRLQADDVDGKFLYINFWAPWCKPCLKELPELNTFAARHADRAMVLAFNVDQPHGDALASAHRLAHIDFPALSENPQTLMALPNVEGVPSTAVLDAQGQLRAWLQGPQTLASLETVLDNP